MIQLKGASDERVEGPLGSIISDESGGVTTLVSNALALVDNISEIRDNGWGKFVGLLRLLGRVGRSLGV